MNNTPFVPRDRRAGAQTSSFYGEKNRPSVNRGNKRASASVRVRGLSEQHLFQLADYGSGEQHSDRSRASVPLDGDSDGDEYDDPENTGRIPRQDLMYTFPGAQQPLSSSSMFNSRQSQLPSSLQQTPRRNAIQGSRPHHSESFSYPINTPGSQENIEQFHPPNSSLPPDFGQMLQQQQVLLIKLLNQQEEIRETQKSFEKRLEGIEDRVASVSQTDSSSSSSPTSSKTKKRKRVVNRRLSMKVTSVHDNLEEKFNPQESSLSDHNKQVSSRIINEIEKTTDAFSEDEIRAAARRKYESVRRQWKADGMEESSFKAEEDARRKKFRQRLHRKFHNRQSVILNEEEKYWNDLSLEFMTEESDDEDDPNCIIEHKLPWRSNDLNEFMCRLDERYSQKVSREGGTVAKKVRRNGVPSTRSPPTDAAEWTIDAGYKDQDQY